MKFDYVESILQLNNGLIIYLNKFEKRLLLLLRDKKPHSFREISILVFDEDLNKKTRQRIYNLIFKFKKNLDIKAINDYGYIMFDDI